MNDVTGTVVPPCIYRSGCPRPELCRSNGFCGGSGEQAPSNSLSTRLRALFEDVRCDPEDYEPLVTEVESLQREYTSYWEWAQERIEKQPSHEPQPAASNTKLSIDGLERLLLRESDAPVRILPDGTVELVPAVHTKEQHAQDAFTLWWESKPPRIDTLSSFMAGYASALLATERATAEPLPSRAFLIFYEDHVVTPEVFLGEGAERAARARFKQARDHWSCHLFAQVDDSTRPAQPQPAGPSGLVATLREIAVRALAVGPKDHNITLDEIQAISSAAERLAQPPSPDYRELLRRSWLIPKDDPSVSNLEREVWAALGVIDR